jgi:ribonuclease H / adenosylcobalamin/alpha-ribazole phosphatase
VTKGVRKAGRTLRDAERRRLAKSSAAARAAAAPRRRAGAATLWCDGGSRGNPGLAAAAYVLEAADGAELASAAAAIGVATAATAEYRAVVLGLRATLAAGVGAVDVCSDSRVVVERLGTAAPLRAPGLEALRREACDLAERIGSVRFVWVPGDANGRADALVAAALGQTA